ncbi:MAG: class IV adenylate cyclase [Chloroflexota bacterium]|nr:class IV adenylate cyclase [Chloroflexota bacterium]
MKNDKMQETEVKVIVSDLDAIAARIEAAGGILASPRVLERNVRYDNASGDFAESGTVLRMRQDSRARLTYKEGDKLQGKYGSTRFEAEVEVSDYDTMALILGLLGYRAAWKYEKYRTTYTLMGAEIVLDELPLGKFIEIEAQDDEGIGEILRVLALEDAPRLTSSYSVLFRIAKERLKFPMNDLTFEAFDGYTVPPGIFA